MQYLSEVKRIIGTLRKLNTGNEELKMLQAKQIIQSYKNKSIESLADVEFKVFSQFGDDGIIQWLINNLDIPYNTFIEFGVENYRESNTRFLMMNNNWSGLVMDGSSKNIEQIRSSEYFWKYELIAKSAFIDSDNINSLISSADFDPEIGLLHIDIDGNDYWIWKEINVINPVIVIVEYNSVFGKYRSITIPYDKKFIRTNAHYSNLYFGSSLNALYKLAGEKGYSFVGCNSSGQNAYFVRTDKLNDLVKPVSLEDGFIESKLRESRNEKGELTYLTGNKRYELIKGMPVFNITTETIEEL